MSREAPAAAGSLPADAAATVIDQDDRSSGADKSRSSRELALPPALPQPPGTPPLPRRLLTPPQPAIVLSPSEATAGVIVAVSPLAAPSLSAGGVLEVELPAWVPRRPIPGLDPSTRYLPVPKVTGLGGYWAKVPERSAPLPMPLDVALKASRMARTAHESIRGILLRETDDELVVKARIVLPFGVKYQHEEHYHKNASVHTSYMRRDVRPGRSVTRIYWTEDGCALLVCESSDLTGHVDHIGYELLRVIEGGDTLHCRQWVVILPSGEMAEQVFVGRRAEIPGKR
ncbi:hypothetical protein GPECTOR_10g864 [Gonium pectorale]|uniref:Uncharacterized protein n=1 Tax=Gonium pectorale TaxID=33097 RepID=A0A150GR21_GONPE|nr:hypothetical protein GPECTOR_10g864 [Gonium pectorale]|eukprot:KXZ52233.1 hypothetical protein GPECTOR_10g864 [Gonium pectorale]